MAQYRAHGDAARVRGRDRGVGGLAVGETGDEVMTPGPKVYLPRRGAPVATEKAMSSPSHVSRTFDISQVDRFTRLGDDRAECRAEGGTRLPFCAVDGVADEFPAHFEIWRQDLSELA